MVCSERDSAGGSNFKEPYGKRPEVCLDGRSLLQSDVNKVQWREVKDGSCRNDSGCPGLPQRRDNLQGHHDLDKGPRGVQGGSERSCGSLRRSRHRLGSRRGSARLHLWGAYRLEVGCGVHPCAQGGQAACGDVAGGV